MGKHFNVKKQQQGRIVPFQVDGEAFYQKGLKAYRNGDLYKAKKYLMRALRIEPNEPVFMCQLAAVLAELGDYGDSNDILIKVIDEVEPTMSECLYFLANNFAHIGLFEKAEKYAERYLIESTDKDFEEDTLELLELLSIETGNEKYTELYSDEDNIIMMQEKAKDHLEKGEIHLAINILEEMIKEHPEFWSAYNNLALAYFYSGDKKRAIELVEEILEKNPGNLHALCNLTIILDTLNYDEEVKNLMDQLKKIHPIHMDHQYKLGSTFGLISQYHIAYRYLNDLHRKGYPGDGSFYYWLSMSAYYVGKQDFAEKIWKRVVEFRPDKAGDEPWKDQDEDRTPLHLDVLRTNIHERILLAQTFKNETSVSKKMFALFVFAKLDDEDSREIINQTIISGDPIISGYAQQLLVGKSNHIGIEVANLLLDGQGKILNEDLFDFWFTTYLTLDAKATKNISAWAGAIEYMYLKITNEKISQSEIAKKYNISSTTLSKYVKNVKEI